MDKDFIEEHGLTEAVRRINEINNYKTPRVSLKEYTFYGGNLNEDDDEPQQDGMQQPQGMNQQDGGNMQQQQQQMPMDNGGMQQQQGGQMPMDGQQQPMDMGQMGGQEQMPMDGQGDMSMDDGMQMPMDDQGFDDSVETEEMEPEDEVVDVDELTQSQEATEYKVDGVDDKISSMMALFNKMVDGLKSNEEKIEALKNEFEKRNPTEEEKLNIRSQSSYPYSETPRDYWDSKMKTSPNYNVMYNNDVSPNEEEKVFEITKDDIDGLDMQSISDSLDYKPNLNDYLKF